MSLNGTVSGSAPRYQVGDLLNVSCYSLNSRPAAKRKWYINGEEADPGMQRERERVREIEKETREREREREKEIQRERDTHRERG